MDGLLPNLNDTDDLIGFSLDGQPSRTYKLDADKKRIQGIISDKEALRQAIYLILSTERYQYPIYSYNYGVELADLIGQPIDYAVSEIKRRITEALMQDDRIKSVENWEFEATRKSVIVTFTVRSIYGDIDIEREVDL